MTRNEENQPISQTIFEQINKIPDAKAGIKNLNELTHVKAVGWTNRAAVINDVKKGGEYTETITITYEDGSTAQLTVKLIVTDDAENYKPLTQPIVVEQGEKNYPKQEMMTQRSF